MYQGNPAFPKRGPAAAPLIHHGLSSSFGEGFWADNGQTEALMQQLSVWMLHVTDVNASRTLLKHGSNSRCNHTTTLFSPLLDTSSPIVLTNYTRGL